MGTCAIGLRPDFRPCVIGYAVQWFALALTLFIIYIVTNLRRVGVHGQGAGTST